jgi:hypothetical protein
MEPPEDLRTALNRALVNCEELHALAAAGVRLADRSRLLSRMSQNELSASILDAALRAQDTISYTKRTAAENRALTNATRKMIHIRRHSPKSSE